MKEVLIKALKVAGRIQLEYFDEKQDAHVKESKSSIVTKVDLKSEQAIIDLIKSNFPSHNILSEECGFQNNDSVFTWVIDPLDGTSNYTAKLPWFGVLIALFENNLPLLGGAYLPAQDLLYFAEKGKGAFCNDVPIKIGDSELQDTLFAFSTDYTEDAAFLDKGLSIFKFIIMKSRNVRTTNSLIDLVFVADGKLGGDINLFTKIWDIAAPFLLITEAGGIVKDLNGNDLIFDLSENGIEKNYPIIASSTSIFEKFKPLL